MVDFYAPFHSSLDPSKRVTIPKHFVGHMDWIRGDVPIAAWLILLSPGRYRLLSDAQVLSDPRLAAIRNVLIEGKAIRVAEPSEALDPAISAMVARLLPIVISPPGPLWRISMPKAFESLAPLDSAYNKVTLLLAAEGYCEIWLTDILRKAAGSAPLESLFDHFEML